MAQFTYHEKSSLFIIGPTGLDCLGCVFLPAYLSSLTLWAKAVRSLFNGFWERNKPQYVWMVSVFNLVHDSRGE